MEASYGVSSPCGPDASESLIRLASLFNTSGDDMVDNVDEVRPQFRSEQLDPRLSDRHIDEVAVPSDVQGSRIRVRWLDLDMPHSGSLTPYLANGGC